MRITRFLSLCGAASRRKAKDIIESGRVRVDGKIVFDLNLQINPSRDKVSLDNEPLSIKKTRYIVLNKPTGYLCSHKDEYERKTVYDLVGDKDLFIAGRLDINSEGLVFLSNDGDFINLLSHPSYRIIRNYRVKVRGVIDRSFLLSLKGRNKTGDDTYYVDRIANISYTKSNTWFDISLHEGKKREIRNLALFHNMQLVRLIRLQLGPFTIHGIKRGSYVEIADERIDEIKRELLCRKD